MIKNAPIWVRSIAVAMLFAMTYYFAGYRIVYFMLTKDAKSYASVEMKKKNVVLEKLQFDKTEYSKIKWTEGNKEFSYNGQLYDVVSISNADGIYSVEVYADKNETQWVKALNDFVKQLFPADNSKSNKNVESVISAFQNEYLPLNTIKVMSPDVTYTVHPSHNVKVASLCTDTSIWHPPTLC
jgi:hypothetical protein